MNRTKTATLKVLGATLYCEVTGCGPPLLLIPGTPADAGGFAALAGQLADRYMVRCAPAAPSQPRTTMARPARSRPRGCRPCRR